MHNVIKRTILHSTISSKIATATATTANAKKGKNNPHIIVAVFLSIAEFVHLFVCFLAVVGIAHFAGCC